MKKLLFTLLSIMVVLMFECQIANAQNDSIDDVTLYEMSLEELMELEVTVAGKIGEKVSDIPASVVIITRKDIERYGYTSITEVLEHTAGFYTIDDYTTTDKVHGNRGLWTISSGFQVLVNNFKDNSGFSVPVNAIDRIEIIRGPMSVIYGSGAEFGAINIITNEVSNEKGLNILSASDGLFNSYDVFARMSGQEGDFKYSFNASVNGTDGVDVAFKDMISDDNMAMLPFVGITDPEHRTTGMFKQQNTYLSLSTNFKHFYSDITYSQKSFGNFFLYPSIKDGNRHKHNGMKFLVGYNRELSTIFSVNAKFTYSYKNWDSDYDLISEEFYGMMNGVSDQLATELNIIAKPIENLNIVTGIEYKNIFHDNAGTAVEIPGTAIVNINTRSLLTGEQINEYAAFTQATYSPGDRLKFVAGVRLENRLGYIMQNEQIVNAINPTHFTYDTIKAKDMVVVPRFATIYSLNENNTIKLLFGQATKYSEAIHLDPERMTTVEANYTFVNSKLLLGVNAFYNMLNDVVVTRAEFDINTGVYTLHQGNFGELSTVGTELLVKAKPINNLLIDFSMTWQKTEDKINKDIEVAYSPTILAKTGISYNYKKIIFSVSGIYVDEMETLWNEAVNPATGELEGARIGDKSDSYFLLGANIRINDIYKGIFINIRGSNLLDEKFRYPVTSQNTLLSKGTFGQERMIFGTIGWKF